MTNEEQSIIDQTALTVFAEKAIVGAVLAEPTVVDLIKLTGVEFFQQEFRRVFEIVRSMREASKPCDIASIVLELKQAKGSLGKNALDDIGGTAALGNLVASSTAASATHYADQVAKWYHVRTMRSRLESSVRMLYETNVDPKEVAKRLEATLQAATTEGDSSSDYGFGEMAAHSLVSALSDVTSSKVVPFGYSSFDSRMGGLYGSEMTILAARPSVGKSALGFGIALNAAKAGKRVRFLSCEMSREQLGHRLLSIETGIPVHRIRNNYLSSEEKAKLNKALASVRDVHGRAWVASNPTVASIRARAKLDQAGIGLDLLVIDYLGLLKASSRGSQYEKITEISAELKGLATELDVPVLVLAQLSREAGKSDDAPKLEHLRDSGSIEQDANNVIFIHRKRGEDKTTIVIAKQRQGCVESFDMVFNSERCCFEDIKTDEEIESESCHNSFIQWNHA